MVLLASLIRQPMLAIAMRLVPALALKEGLNLRMVRPGGAPRRAGHLHGGRGLSQ